MRAVIGWLVALSVGLVLLLVVLVVTMGGQIPARTAPPLRPGTVPAVYAALVNTAGTLCPAVTPALLAAQLEAESGWNPRAVSRAGAQGLAQFMPATWRRWGRDGDGDGPPSPFDPADAILSQATYDCHLASSMSAAKARGAVTGDLVELLLAAYNAGPGAVLAAKGIPRFEETRDYVNKITQRMEDLTAAVEHVPVVARGFATRFVEAARGQTGVPYVWSGGSFRGPTRGGLDCSGLVLYAAYRASGGSVKLPHSADAQTRTGTPVPRDRLRPGDVISFTSPGEAVAHHVGIYLGGGTMIHAPRSGTRVRTADLTTSYWRSQQWRAVRYA